MENIGELTVAIDIRGCAIWMVKLRHLEGKNLVDFHEFAKFANIFPLKYFPRTVSISLNSLSMPHKF